MKGETIRAAIMADTHGVLRPEVEKILETCDVVIHAGDFDNQLLYHKLSSDWPFYGVRGNNDRGWSGGLPLVKRFEIGGVKFVMAHEREHIPSALQDAKVVIFGHSHMYQQQEINGRLWLNPGSCGYKRFTLPLSLAVMTIVDGTYELETIWLEKGYGTPGAAIAQREKAKKSRYEKQQKKYLEKQEQAKKTEKSSEKQPDREELFRIAKILRLQKAGNDSQWIAGSLDLDMEQVQDICQIAQQLPQADARSVWKLLHGTEED